MGEAIYLVNNFKVEKVNFNKEGYNDLELELIKVLKKRTLSIFKNIKTLNKVFYY